MHAESTALRELARDRPLVTRELHVFNAFYGHDAVLRRHAGIPNHGSLKLAIEHGIGFSDAFSDRDLTMPLPFFLCASEHRATLYARHAATRAEAVPIGPMIAYVPGGGAASPDGRRTLLVFPGHSTHHARADFDVDVFLRTIDDHARRFDRVVVCLYWKDVLLGRGEAYRARDLECVTAGHIYDRAFLPRLRAILESGSAVVTNELGSHIAYATALSRPVWLVQQDVGYAYEGAPARHGWDALEQPTKAMIDVRRAFAEPSERVTDEQRQLIDEVAGTGSIRTPGELREVIEEADHRYRRLSGGTRARLQARSLLRRWHASAVTAVHRARPSAAGGVGCG